MLTFKANGKNAILKKKKLHGTSHLQMPVNFAFPAFYIYRSIFKFFEPFRIHYSLFAFVI